MEDMKELNGCGGILGCVGVEEGCVGCVGMWDSGEDMSFEALGGIFIASATLPSKLLKHYNR
jgi:hypothetical protein